MTFQKHHAEDLATRPVAANGASDKPSRESSASRSNRDNSNDWREPHDAHWVGEVTLRSSVRSMA